MTAPDQQQDQGAGLVAALANSFHSDQGLRRQAERRLQDFETKFAARFLPVLLDVVAETTIALPIRQAAALRVKSLVARRFGRRAADEADVVVVVAPADIALLRRKIVETIFTTADVRSLRVQLLAAIAFMIRADYPDEWPDLVAVIAPYLRSLGALSILRIVYCRFQHYRVETTPVLAQLLNDTLPIVHRIVADDVQQWSSQQEQLERIKLCFKIYHHAIRQPIPAAVQEASSFLGWAKLALQVIGIVPSQTDPALPTIVSIQKRALICLVPLLSLFGRVAESQDPADKQFSRLYMSQVAPALLDGIVHLLQRPVQVVSRPMLQSAFSFLASALTHAALYNRFRPYLQTILIDGIFRTLSLSDDEAELFDSDGAEFARRGLDVTEAFDDPRINACNMLVDLVRVRTSDVLPTIMHIIDRNLSSSHVLEIDGALMMFGCLSRVFLAKLAQIPIEVPTIFSQKVVPLLHHAHGIVRTRSSWVCGRYYLLPCSGQSIGPIFDLLLKDGQIPVVTAASIAFNDLLRAHPTAIEQLKAHLPIILEQYVSLIDTVGNESVITVLEDIVGRFPARSIAPFAAQLTDKLLAVFAQLVFAGSSDDVDEEKQFYAMGVVRVVVALFESVGGDAALYSAMETMTIATINEIVDHERNVLQLESAIDLLRVMSDVSPTPFSPFLGAIPSRLAVIGSSVAVEYVSAMVPVFRNCMARNGSAFYTRDTLQPILHMCAAIMQMSDAAHDGKYAAQLLESMIGFCTAATDDSIRQLLCSSVTQLVVDVFLASVAQAADDFTYQVFCSMLSNVLSYSAMMMPTTFLDHAHPTTLLPIWIRFIPTMPWEMAEMCLVAMSSLLTVDWSGTTDAGGRLLADDVLAVIPGLCRHLVNDIDKDHDDDDDDGDGEARRHGGGFKDVQLDQDWNSDDDTSDQYYDDEELVDEGASLPVLDLQAMFTDNMGRVGQLQQHWQATLSEDDRTALQRYAQSGHGAKRRP